MKKIICIFLVTIFLTIFLTGCSLKETKQTSVEIKEENINNIIQEKEQIETEENEIQYLKVVLNNGWKDKQNKKKIIETLDRITTNSNQEENTQNVQTNNGQAETDSFTNNIQEREKEDTDYIYYIKINYTANVLTIYTKDEEGEYTVPYKAMLCSTGRSTPRSGVYSIIYKYRWLEMLGGVYAQYCNQVVGNILIHSVPYLTKYDNGSLEYWEYDKLGTTASAGCIRLTTINAKWIYENCKNGTPVEFYSSEEPGPLGKPEEMKISSYTEYRDWDPTDPDENNPWNNYLQ